MIELSIVIPSLNEPYLDKTVEDIKRHAETDIEVLVGDDAVEKLGQRALTNKLVREAKGKYILKCDAHVSFSQGFDKHMLEEIDDRTILAPLMGVLDPVGWTINGKKMVSRYGFDTNLIMQYLPETDDEETPCLQGSAFMMSKENYFKWGVDDESLGSWGQQAVQLGILAYLNGGRCRTTKKAYYGHVFRHSDADFPYDRGPNPGQFANSEMKRRYLNQSIAGLIEKHNYFCDWTPEIVHALPDVV